MEVHFKFSFPIFIQVTQVSATWLLYKLSFLKKEKEYNKNVSKIKIRSKLYKTTVPLHDYDILELKYLSVVGRFLVSGDKDSDIYNLLAMSFFSPMTYNTAATY